MMKQIFLCPLFLLMLGTGSLALAGPYYGDSGSRSHNPYLSEPDQPQRQPQDSGAYRQDYLNNPEYNPSQNLTKPNVTEPRRWYDSEKNYQESYGTRVAEPKTLTNPYKAVRPYSSQELTSPYDEVFPQKTEKPTGGQQLTPPTSRSNN
jgi:hypothetical protein